MRAPRQQSLRQKVPVLQDRARPHNMDAEQAALGGILFAAQVGDADAITSSIAALGEEAFYLRPHTMIYCVMRELHRAGRVPDLITVTDELGRLGQLADSGGAGYVTGLLGSVFGTALLPQHVRLLRALWAKRAVAELAGEVYQAALNGANPGALISVLEQGLEFLREVGSGLDGPERLPNRIQTATDLLAGAEEGQRWWSLWGQPGLIGPGVATLISGHAKVAGKTTAIGIGIRDLLQQYPDLCVLVLTEEPPSLWRARLRRWGVRTPNLRFRFADGTPWLSVLDELSQDAAAVIVVDTLRAFAGVTDENDASAVIAAVQPLVLLARRKNIAVSALHHLRKTEGDEGLAHPGSTALVGLFDVAVELRRDEHAPRRRILKAVSRFEETPRELVLELRGDQLVALGSPEAVTLREVVERVLTVLPPESRMTLREISEALDEPKPSKEQISRALRQLHAESQVIVTGRGVKGDPQRWGHKP